MAESHRMEALEYHSRGPSGKVTVNPTKPCETAEELALAYTPGVAEPCMEIYRDPGMVYDYTAKGNLVAVVTNGTAVLGLGDIGPLAAKPVMEGKAVLFKRFAGVDAIDIDLKATTADDIVHIVEAIAPTFGGINLEDIKAPECFEVETRLRERLDIPVFHDDQHGTAIVLAAGLVNALKQSGRSLDQVRIVVNGAGAAAIAIIHLLWAMGAHQEQITVVDRSGVIFRGREQPKHKEELAVKTTARSLADAVVGADVFIGVSVGDALTPEMLLSMAENPIVFALANPTPEIDYDLAKSLRPDSIVATGRSDFPNQVNNVLAFPYIFRAALDVRASTINVDMYLAASKAIASLATGDSLVPSPFLPALLPTVASAVAAAAMGSGVARRSIPADYYCR